MTVARGKLILVLIALCSLGGPGAALGAGESVLIEGFESLDAIRPLAGSLAEVRAEDAATQGRCAAQFSADAQVDLGVSGAELKRRAWLKIDTMTSQPITQSAVLEFRVPGRLLRFRAWVRAGKDTIALPLARVIAEATQPVPDRSVPLRIANGGEAPLIVDNVRLEPAATPPDGAVLLDFGPEEQVAWPGFAPAGATEPRTTWSGRGTIQGYSSGMPDPLGGDFVGRRPGPEVLDGFTLATPSGKPAAAWFWVTHYGSLRFTQPMQYAFRIDGDVAFQRRLSRRDMLGGDGLLKGIDGEWTPTWYDRQYAPQFVRRVQADLGGRARIEVGNCQIAALAVAPAAQRAGLARYVHQVEEDLSRYRRQFVAGMRADPICRLDPTEAERKSGLMVFRPPAGEAFSAEWTPQAADRVEALHAEAVNGGLAVIPLAVAPVERCSYLGGSADMFRTKRGRRLPVPARGIEVHAVHRVPRLRDGRILFQPWIVQRRHGSLQPKEVALFLATFRVGDSARSGVYSGELRVTGPSGSRKLPVKLRIARIGDVSAPRCTIGMTLNPAASSAYGPLAAQMPEARRREMERRLQENLLAGPFNALELPGARLGGDGEADEGRLLSALRDYPRRRAGGDTLLNIMQTFYLLGRQRVPPGSARFHRSVASVVRKTNGLVSRARLPGLYYHLGWAPNRRRLDQAGARAEAVSKAGGRPAVTTYASRLTGLSRQELGQTAGPFDALLLVPNSEDLPEFIEAFKNLPGSRRAFVYSLHGTRYKVGLYAAAVGAEGCYLGRLFAHTSPYEGHHFDGTGLLALEPDGSFAETLGMLRLRRGLSEYMLFRRAEALLGAAKEAKVQAMELSTVLEEIRDLAGTQAVGYDPWTLCTTALDASRINALRSRLIRAAEVVAGRGG